MFQLLAGVALSTGAVPSASVPTGIVPVESATAPRWRRTSCRRLCAGGFCARWAVAASRRSDSPMDGSMNSFVTMSSAVRPSFGAAPWAV